MQGAKIKRGGDASLLFPNFYVLPALPNFSVFKVVCHEHPFAFSLSAMSVMP